MFRYVFSILLCTLGALFASAQTATGWYRYPNFTGDIDKLIATHDCVYYRSGSNLFSYNENDNENMAHSTDNGLSDVEIREIYYNIDKGYLLVAYENGNIDLLYPSGKCINLPDIKDANVYSGRGINGVTFADDRIYVATDFGFVVFDDTRYEVKESAIFNKPVYLAAPVDGYMVIYYEQTFRKAPLSGNYKHLDSYTEVLQYNVIPTYAYVAGKKLMVNGKNASYCVDTEANKLDYYITPNIAPLQKLTDGTYFTATASDIHPISTDGKMSATISLPSALSGKKISYVSSTDEIWSASADGVAKYNIAGEQLCGAILPVDCITVDKVNLMSWSPDRQRLYITRANPSKGRPGSLDGPKYPQSANVISGREPIDVTIRECTLVNYYNGTAYQNSNGDKRLYGGNYWICENPFDKEMYFTSSDWNGVLASKNGKMVTSFISTNSKYANYANRAEGVFIDPKNNLWIAMINNSGSPFMQVLPAEKIKPENIASVTKDDWKQTAVTGEYTDKNATMLFSTHSNLAYYFCGNWGFGIVAYDTKGTYADPTDDEARQWSKLTDQDGKSYSPTRTHALAEDKNGHIWVGTTSGVVIIKEPANGLNDNFTVFRPKVARNDGTNFADYLLESDAVLWIGVDPANNKWLATENSGLYLVNSDGSQILAHYNTDNSPLASNTIYTVEQDPNSNLVYVGTDAGLYRFNSSTSPAADDYSEIYAYPNPVRPEYTGSITISGLTDASLVKITDAAGNLIAQTTASGGMAVWDGCNLNGVRVRSGVYYVFASSGANDEQGKGAVTKIIVIN